MEKDIDVIIKTAFKDRQLEVSSNAFGRLMDKKKLRQSKSKTRLYKFLALAASVLLFIILINESKQDTGFKTDVKITKTKQNPVNINKQTTPNSEFNNTQKTSIPLLAEQDKPQKLIPIQTLKSKAISDQFSNLKIAENTPILRIPHFRHSAKFRAISDGELDSLLASASSKINQKTGDSLRVDALQMLNEIEIEINKPLPEKVILTLKSGSKTVKDIFNQKQENQ